MRILKLLSCITLFIACNQNKNSDSKANQTNTVDSLKTVDKVTKKDTSEEAALENSSGMDQAIYRNKTKIDSTFFRRNVKFQLSVETDFDSSKKIVIPKKYVEVYGLDSFEVFEMYTKFKLLKGDHVIFDTTIRKRDFSQQFDSAISKYGNLMFPVVKIQDRYVELGHSLSIPMTDVGIGVTTIFPFAEKQ